MARSKELIIIAAAGWKGSGAGAKAPPGPDLGYPLAGYPEPFLPVGNGETTLSRLVRQFHDLGFRDFAIGVTEPGYQIRPPFDKYHPRPNEEILGSNFTPWTDELVKYAARFGEVIAVPDPRHRTPWHTAATVLEKCGVGYDATLILPGDFVFSDKFAKLVAAMPRPAELNELDESIRTVKGSIMFWLNGESSTVYIKKAWRSWEGHETRDIAFRRERRGAMVQALRGAGVPSIHLEQFLACNGFYWRDIDNSRYYANILNLLENE